MRPFLILGVCALALTISFLFPATGRTGAPEWPDDVEKKLEKADSDLLSLQRKRAVARLRGDRKGAKEMDRDFEDLQKSRLKLLKDTHQF